MKTPAFLVNSAICLTHDHTPRMAPGRLHEITLALAEGRLILGWCAESGDAVYVGAPMCEGCHLYEQGLGSDATDPCEEYAGYSHWNLNTLAATERRLLWRRGFTKVERVGFTR